PTDAPAALELLLGAPNEDSERWLVADALFHDRLHAPDTPLLVAEWNGVFAGVAVLSLHQTLRGWHATLDDLVVAPAYRRRGVGTALVTAAVPIAWERGCAAFHVIAPHVTAEARALLIASGF